MMNLRKLFGVFGTSFVLLLLFTHLLPITDPVESNYVLTAKEMYLSSDWISPRIYGQVWYDKPVMFYWLLAAVFKTVGFSELAMRAVPCFFGAIGITLISWFVAEIASPRQGLIAATILGTFFQYFLLSKFLITDMVLFVFNSAALVFFFLGYLEIKGTKKWYILMYPCLALAVLTKGPVGIILPGIVSVVFLASQRKWSELTKMYILPGTMLFAGIAFPWYILMYLKHGTDFLASFFGVHNYLRATVSEHPKDNVFYYYVVVYILSTLPWTGLATAGLYMGYKNARHNPESAFFMIWAAVYFIFYSLMATKYLTYTFPMLFPVAVLTARFTDHLMALKNRKNMFYMIGIPFILMGAGLLGFSYKYLDKAWFVVLTVSIIVMISLILRQIRRCKIEKTFTKGVYCVIACYIFISALVLPVVAEFRSGKFLADLLVSFDDYKIGVYHDYSTAAVFYSGKVLVKIETKVNDTLQTNKLSWVSKYTMPTSSLHEFINESKIYKVLIVVPIDKKEEFEQEAKDVYFMQVKCNQKFILYEVSDYKE